MQRKLIPEALSDWMKNQADEYRSKSKSLYKTLGIDLPKSRPTDGYTMAMVVSNVWEGIFSEQPIEDIFNSIGKKYDVDSSVIMQNFMKHWSAGLDYHLVLRMRELSPFEMGLVATFVSPIIEKNKSNPFFCFLSFNAPHTPLQLPEKYYNLYKNVDIQTNVQVSKTELKLSDQDIEDAKKIYGMITNIDDNLGKLFSKLKELKIDKETVVIFMTDNGPQQLRYNANMKGRKGTVYNGGIRVPFFLKVPNKFKDVKVKEINKLSAHIDLVPTISELCDVELPKNKKIDGKSLIPLLELSLIHI